MPQTASKQPAFVFRAQDTKILHKIPGSMWQRLKTKSLAYGEEPLRVLYRILQRKPRSIVPFINAALKAEDLWPFKPCYMEVKSPRVVNDWIDRFAAHNWSASRGN